VHPAISQGASTYVAYNWIVNPGEVAIHFSSAPGAEPVKASLLGNRVDFGADSDTNIPAVLIPDDMVAKQPGALIYSVSNTSPAGPLLNKSGLPLLGTPPVVLATPIAQPDDVRAAALKYSGKMPADRDPVDARIVSEISAQTTRIIDDPAQVGGLGAQKTAHAVAQVPSSPFSSSGVDDLWRVEAWLCALHLQVGGPNTPECPRSLSVYQTATH